MTSTDNVNETLEDLAAEQETLDPTTSGPVTDSTTTPDNVRIGTTASARFNILSTMVGGGCLSLPLAFEKTGNALLAPVFLLVIAAVSEFCFNALITSARVKSPIASNQVLRGSESFESLALAAFGSRAYTACMVLVTSMCFFGIVGYSVLLRDMLQPISDALWKGSGEAGPSLHNNLTMLTVVLVVTPLCTLQTLTALQKFGALSMASILILGTCIVIRSLQCNLGHESVHFDNDFHIRLLPTSWKDVLDAFPLFVSCYVCHYNIVTVHNELRNPTLPRVQYWLRSTTWAATLFYMTLGVAGSMYGKCTPTGTVQGNVLLDFDEQDPLLLVGRMCLALTITLAFPMLTIPARDIVLRRVTDRSQQLTTETEVEMSLDSPNLQESLLPNDHLANETTDEEVAADTVAESLDTPAPQFSLMSRLLASILVLWTAAGVASCVSSIDIVWDLLGSSLSMLLSYIIPCGSYLVITKEQGSGGPNKMCAWFLLVVSFPLMVASTVNAVYNTFFA